MLEARRPESLAYVVEQQTIQRNLDQPSSLKATGSQGLYWTKSTQLISLEDNPGDSTDWAGNPVEGSGGRGAAGRLL